MNDLAHYLNSELFWKFVLAALELTAAFVAGSLAGKAVLRLSRKAVNKGVMTFLASFVNIAVKIAGAIIALDQIGVSMNLIIGTLSALGVGISLAIKDNMRAVASGLQILLTKPFQVGDYIKVDHREGTVVSIELTYTVLRTNSDNTIILPNDKAIFKSIINYSTRNDRRLIIEYPCKREEIGEVRTKLLKAAASSSLILSDPAPDIWIKEWFFNGATLQLVVFTRPADYWNASTQINNLIHEQMDVKRASSPEKTDQAGK